MQIGASNASRRHHFRLGRLGTACSFELPGGEPIVGQAEDVGGGGLLLVTGGSGADVPIGSMGLVRFGLLQESFLMPGYLVRRTQTEAHCALALTWPEAPPREVDRLMYCLYRLQAGRRPAEPAPSEPREPDAEAGLPARPPVEGRRWLLAAAAGVAAGALVPAPRGAAVLAAAVLVALWWLGGALPPARPRRPRHATGSMPAGRDR